jgi:hypothetical protein
MNARVTINTRPLMTTGEAQSHLAIVHVLEQAKVKHWHWSYVRDAVWASLESFRPRCNCGYVLRFSPWLDGLRVAKCEGCGWKTLESPLNQGAGK